MCPTMEGETIANTAASVNTIAQFSLTSNDFARITGT
jgi:hypothetical protein